MNKGRLLKILKEARVGNNAQEYTFRNDLNREYVSGLFHMLEESVNRYEIIFKSFNDNKFGDKNIIKYSLKRVSMTKKDYLEFKEELKNKGVNTQNLPNKLNYLEARN